MVGPDVLVGLFGKRTLLEPDEDVGLHLRLILSV
jgi:hypothetical protein